MLAVRACNVAEGVLHLVVEVVKRHSVCPGVRERESSKAEYSSNGKGLHGVEDAGELECVSDSGLMDRKLLGLLKPLQGPPIRRGNHGLSGHPR